jgi:transposase
MQDALDQLPPNLKEIFSQLVDDHKRLTIENMVLRMELRKERIERFGPSSEKLTDEQLELLDQEPSVSPHEVEQEVQHATEPPPKPRKKSKRSGRVELPDHLEKREVKIPCPPQECVCPICQQEKAIMGYDRSETLGVIPAHYFIKVTLREKRACPHHPEGGVVTAPCPERIIPKGKLSDEMIVDVLIKKYGDHLPAYRQSAILLRDAGIDLSRKTLIGVIMRTGDLLQALVAPLKKDLFAGEYIQADETRMPCQTPAKRGRHHRAFYWEYSRPGGPAVFDFQMNRARAGPEGFLQGFEGILQVDGYSAYDKLGDGIVYAGCMAHMRREFHRAYKLQPTDPRPQEVLQRIGQLYEVEKQAREGKLSCSQRHRMRQEKSRPVFEALGKRIVEIRAEPDTLPLSQLGKACNYAMGQWSRLGVYLEHGQAEIDNNKCENGIRPLALGRKNWLQVGSEEAGPRIGAIISIFETCRRLEINVRDYLLDVLPKLPEWPINRVEELTPMAWKARQVS